MWRYLYLAILLFSKYAHSDNYSGGTYVGIGSGYGDRAILGRFFIGNMFNNLVGIEAAYTVWEGSGHTLSTNGLAFNYDLQPQTLDGQIVFNLPIGVSPLSLHAKIGLAYGFINSNSTTALNHSGITTTPGGAGFTSVGGIGAGLNIGRNLKLDLDWSSYGFIQPINIAAYGNTNVAKWSSNNFEMNLSYYF